MAVIQEISARIGRTTGEGIAANIRRHYPNWILQIIIGLLLVANTINIGADLGAMGEAVALLAGGPKLLYVIAFGLICAVLQVVVQYTRYVSVSQMANLGVVRLFWDRTVRQGAVGGGGSGFFIPSFSGDTAFWTTVVAIFGTTISPYLFFWQASQEVEEIGEVAERRPRIEAPRQGADAIERIGVDTYVGMAFSNLVALAIMVTAGTLHASGETDIQTSSQARRR